jgi:hypothetical protein
MSTIEQRLEQDRDWISWVPGGDTEKYDTRNPLVGRLVDRTVITGGQYGDSTVMILETEDGTRIGVWLNRTVLKNEVREQAPQWGEKVGIKYLGEITPAGGGANYHSYKVAVDRPIEDRAPIAWSDAGDGDSGPARVVYGDPSQTQEMGAAPTAKAVVHEDDSIPF